MNLKGLVKKTVRKVRNSFDEHRTNSNNKYSVIESDRSSSSTNSKMDKINSTEIKPRQSRNKMSFGKSVINIIHRIVVLLVRQLCQFINGEKGKSMPPIRNLILLDPASTLALKIRTRKVSNSD